MLATVATQPLIVAKVALQSKPPPAREGKPFKGFVEVMEYIVEHEGLLSLFKGIKPQIMKGFLVQGILMMTKEKYVHCSYHFDMASDVTNRMEFMFVLLFRYMRKLRDEQLQKVAAKAAEQAKKVSPAMVK